MASRLYYALRYRKSRSARQRRSTWHLPAYGMGSAAGATVVVAMIDGGFRGLSMDGGRPSGRPLPPAAYVLEESSAPVSAE